MCFSVVILLAYSPATPFAQPARGRDRGHLPPKQRNTNNINETWRAVGCSTYVAARFYHRAVHSDGQKVFILTHSDQATQNLFEVLSLIADRVRTRGRNPYITVT